MWLGVRSPCFHYIKIRFSPFPSKSLRSFFQMLIPVYKAVNYLFFIFDGFTPPVLAQNLFCFDSKLRWI
ncbi:hypothetical protein EZS27_002028 [termite gut metagenome]|uniref:Uncharacterized protein n=1 Tax=termite gut metagenome TaxID=433724 RepID=A0A5J4SZE0_9ZZZZ